MYRIRVHMQINKIDITPTQLFYFTKDCRAYNSFHQDPFEVRIREWKLIGQPIVFNLIKIESSAWPTFVSTRRISALLGRQNK